MPKLSVTIELAGIEGFRSALKTYQKQVRAAVARALNEEHERLMTEAKSRMPVCQSAVSGIGGFVFTFFLSAWICFDRSSFTFGKTYIS